MKTRFIHSLVAVLLLSLQAKAITIKNTETSEAKLGQGVRVATEQFFSSCLADFSRNDMQAEDSLSKDTNPTGTTRLEVTSEVIRSYQKLDEYMNQSISADVQYMAYSGSAHYNHEKQTNISSDQITVGIQARADYGRWYLKNPQLTPEAKALAEANIQQFYQTCGQEFISGYRLGQGLRIVLRTLDTSSYSYEKLDIGASGSVKGTEGASGSIQAAFLNVASALLKFSSLEVRIIGFGTGNLSTTSAMIKTPKDVEKIMEVISDMLKEMESNQAVITEYLTSTYPVQHQPYRAVIAEAQRRTLADLFGAFRQVDSDLSRMRKYVNINFANDFANLCVFAAKHPDKIFSCDQYSGYVKSLTQDLDVARNHLVKAIQMCASSERIEDCKLSDLEVQMQLAAHTKLWPNQYKRKLQALKYKFEIDEIIQKAKENGGNL